MKKIFILIIGIIIGLTTGIMGATYIYHANEVSYTPSNSNFNVDNVEDAINELYGMVSSGRLIPALTSNTSSIVSSFSSAGTDYDLYKFFDNDSTTRMLANSTTNTVGSYIGYMFDEKHYVQSVNLLIRAGTVSTSVSWNFKIQYYDGTNWVDLDNEYTCNYATDCSDIKLFAIDVDKNCYGIRMYFTGGTSILYEGHYGLNMYDFQLYGY